MYTYFTNKPDIDENVFDGGNVGKNERLAMKLNLFNCIVFYPKRGDCFVQWIQELPKA